jgi:L-threonylcarbamoyladenylate synthase
MARIVSVNFAEAPLMAAQALQEGGLVVLPTDTVYGVASRIEVAAIDHLFAAKKRPPDRAIPVLLSDIDAVELVARDFPEPARQLAAAFWPGPLTLALPKRDGLPANLSAIPTVGVRVPDLDQTRSIISAAGGALAVSSANRSDQPPACTIQAAIRYLSDAVALYLDGGTCVGGVPSTVVSFDGDKLRIVRAGPISEDALLSALILR